MHNWAPVRRVWLFLLFFELQNVNAQSETGRGFDGF
jgi:hypothetical protein